MTLARTHRENHATRKFRGDSVPPGSVPATARGSAREWRSVDIDLTPRRNRYGRERLDSEHDGDPDGSRMEGCRVGAFVLWLVGRWMINFATRTLGRALSRQQCDVTLTRYLQTGVSVLLNIALLVAILGFFGVATTTFAALLVAGGVAIGVAWGGLLSNFA